MDQPQLLFDITRRTVGAEIAFAVAAALYAVYLVWLSYRLRAMWMSRRSGAGESHPNSAARRGPSRARFVAGWVLIVIGVPLFAWLLYLWGLAVGADRADVAMLQAGSYSSYTARLESDIFVRLSGTKAQMEWDSLQMGQLRFEISCRYAYPSRQEPARNFGDRGECLELNVGDLLKVDYAKHLLRLWRISGATPS